MRSLPAPFALYSTHPRFSLFWQRVLPLALEPSARDEYSLPRIGHEHPMPVGVHARALSSQNGLGETTQPVGCCLGKQHYRLRIRYSRRGLHGLLSLVHHLSVRQPFVVVGASLDKRLHRHRSGYRAILVELQPLALTDNWSSL